MTPASIPLSEAMRLGAMAIPPVHGPIFDGPEVCAACAIGTPLYAVMGKAAYVVQSSGDGVEAIKRLYEQYWPWTTVWVRNPAYGIAVHVVAALIDLFETHRWSREQIADWIASIEPAPDAEAPSASPVDHVVTEVPR